MREKELSYEWAWGDQTRDQEAVEGDVDSDTSSIEQANEDSKHKKLENGLNVEGTKLLFFIWNVISS